MRRMGHNEAQSARVVHSAIPAALAAQSAGAIAAAALWLLARDHVSMPIVALAMAQACIAALVGLMLGQPRWWLAIHSLFGPCALAALSLGVDPRWYLAGFVALALVFGGVYRSRVPLYLSSTEATDALLAVLPCAARLRFLDLGCGLGSVLDRVSRKRPDAACVGVEAALLPWLVAWLRSRRGARYRVRRASLWNTRLHGHDVVYAYLSPAAMPALWIKAKREMTPGSLLVSNSFPVPQAHAAATYSWGGRGGDKLFVYRI
jgi:hypothetical protein